MARHLSLLSAMMDQFNGPEGLAEKAKAACDRALANGSPRNAIGLLNASFLAKNVIIERAASQAENQSDGVEWLLDPGAGVAAYLDRDALHGVECHSGGERPFGSIPPKVTERRDPYSLNPLSS